MQLEWYNHPVTGKIPKVVPSSNHSSMQETREILPAVAAIIFNEKGEVLLQRRKDVAAWCIISGHVEFGESISEAILRELQEETHTEARIIRFIGMYSSPQYQTYHYPERSVQYITAYFEAAFLQEPDLGFSSNETMELKYFPLHHLPENMAQINPEWLEDALQHSGTAFLR